MIKQIPISELKILKKLNSPTKIQDFLDSIPINFEPGGDTCYSPMTVLKKKKCHCIEAAVLAALALRVAGQPPLVLDLTANQNDYDHVVTLFKKYGKWGAISKTNHLALRYREPIYQSIRELVMSYFHEYTLDDGSKTLRSYTLPVNLSRFDRMGWMTAEEDVWFVPNTLDSLRHLPILTRSQIAGLRKADPIERKIGKILEWRK